MAGGKSATKKVAIAERQQIALSLRKSGASFRAIAAHISALPGNEKYSEGLAHHDVSTCLKVLNEQTSLDTEAYRSLELERLDTAQLAIAKLVQSGNLQAIDRWIRISERRAALLGLNEPIRLKIEQCVEAELSAFLSSLESALPAEIYKQVLSAIASLDSRAATAANN